MGSYDVWQEALDNISIDGKRRMRQLIEKYGSHLSDENMDIGDGVEFQMLKQYKDEVLAEMQREQQQKMLPSELVARQRYENKRLALQAAQEREVEKYIYEHFDSGYQLEHKNDIQQKQRSSLVDTYGEYYDVRPMNRDDYETYLDTMDLNKDMWHQRMYDTEAKKNGHLEYTLRDNFAKLKDYVQNDGHYRKRLRDFEGTVDYPYLDTKGLKTAGVGFNYNRWDDFKEASWRIKGEDGAWENASEQQKQEAYNKLQAKRDELFAEWRRKHPMEDEGKFTHNYGAAYFKNLTSLRLAPEVIEKVEAEKLKEAVNKLKERFDKYNGQNKARPVEYTKLPLDVLGGMIDIMYNIGNMDEYVKLPRALARNDFATAARESSRIVTSDSVKRRNKYVRDVLLQYVKK